MYSPSSIRRVVLVVLDGLRADAIARYRLPSIERLLPKSAWTLHGATVAPSVTAAAMGSLFTGAPPTAHGLISDRFHLPGGDAGSLIPLPRLLAASSLPTTLFVRSIPLLSRGLAHAIGRHLGVRRSSFAGDSAVHILESARGALGSQRQGLIFMHWPDADQAGHSHGWMSAEYESGARRLDDCLGALWGLLKVPEDPTTLLIVLADHGGGGVNARDHDSEHPDDRTIPLMIAGGAVVAGELPPTASLLDVPATILWALGLPQPESYVGRPLIEAFARVAEFAA